MSTEGEVFLGSGYGAVVTVLSAVALVIALITFRLVNRPSGLSDENDKLVTFVLVAAISATLLSGLRVWVGSSPTGYGWEDSAFRIALTALRVFIVAALLLVVWRETSE